MKVLTHNQLDNVNGGGLLDGMIEQYDAYCQEATEAGQFVWDFVDQHPGQAALAGVGIYLGFKVVTSVLASVARAVSPRNGLHGMML